MYRAGAAGNRGPAGGTEEQRFRRWRPDRVSCGSNGWGAALYYFKFKKPRADTKGSDDLDEYDFGDDEDLEDEVPETETEQEDDEE